MSRCFNFRNHTQDNLKFHPTFFDPLKNTSRMQCTQTLWIHVMSSRKNWVAHMNWMNGKKSEAFIRRCSEKKVFLKTSQNSQENIFARASFFCRPQNFIKKETLAQVFTCEFREIFKNTFFIKHLWWLLLKNMSIQ